jgi:hypothetical protein
MLDTGVDARHPALRGRVAGFLAVDEDGVARPEHGPDDDDGHGTHTAALICGREAIGVAPTARLYCAAVIERGRVPVRLLIGLDWLARQPIRVVHLPLGIVGQTPLLERALWRLRRRGVLAVAAVGNGGSARFDSPGCYPHVLSVGACDERGEPAAFSGSWYATGVTRCLKPDVLAPGVDVRSAAPGGGHARQSGTSMASAHVAGVAALLFSAVPGATPGEVESAIVRSARPLARPLSHRSRHGVVDADAALALLRGGACPRRPARPRLDWRGQPRCDPRMTRKLALRWSGDELEAIVMLRPRTGGPALAGRVAQHARACRRPGYRLRLLPGGRDGVLVGHHELMRRLLDDPAVAYLHSTEIDVVGWTP